MTAAFFSSAPRWRRSRWRRSPGVGQHVGAILGFALFLVAGSLLAATPAQADLRLCNMTSSRVGIALGYRDAQGWVTEGWWNLNSRGCETLLKGQLSGRFYYVYALDYDRGGEWSGRSFMCTREREFTVRGTEDCLARGFDRSGFFEVDTGEQKSWTIQLTETNRPGGNKMKRGRRTKILATLGPASENPEMIAKLFQAGADVFRLNMSHLPREKLRERVAMIRAVEAKFKRPIAILADLQGPKLRVDMFENDGVTLVKGQAFTLDADKTLGTAKRVHLPHPEILSSLEPGHTILIDDGKLRLRVKSVKEGSALTEVEVAGRISNRKGVSLPDTVIPVAAMTEKDRSDLEAALDAGVDWIALSFVQRPEDVAEVKKVAQGRALVMSKLEKPQAITRLDEIMEISDAVMVARGDLGVEMPLEKVPGIQKLIVRTARRLGKPVVVATQMLESMIVAPVPTRAEVSDVATAVYDGADAVMLSAESASGQYPVEAVATMSRIAEEVEQDQSYWTIMRSQATPPEQTGSDAIAAGAHQIADTLQLKTIAAWTSSGSTAFRIARERPNSTVVALTPNDNTARRLSLVWGVHPIRTKDASDVDDMAFRACKFAVREGFSQVGERIIIVAGVPFGTPGATNMVRVAFISPEHAAKA